MAGVNFWDFKDDVPKQRGGARQAANAARGSGPKDPLTVTQLTALIETALRKGVPPVVTVLGEASNYKAHRSGHVYFTLKDPGACIDCVMFRDDAARVRFKPSDGMELVASGSIRIFREKGKYQLYVTSLAPVGQGALELARQQILARLQAEGLFDPQRKKPMPAYPQRVALVTSPQTAAIHDMFKVLRRFGFISLLVCPVPVQGEGSAEKIASAIRYVNRRRESLGGIDVLIVARGGGSLEDLWEFNEECVARAIAGSAIPVITGIGHEIDVSIADLAADYHAHTPTEAAQVATNLWRGARHLIDGTVTRLRRELRAVIADAKSRIAAIARHECFRRPLDRVNQLRRLLDDRQQQLVAKVERSVRAGWERVDGLAARMQERHPRIQVGLCTTMVEAMAARLALSAAGDQARRLAMIDALAKRLEALNPQGVLRRGYSITTSKRRGTVIRSPSQVKLGETLVTRVTQGEIESTVEDAGQMRLFEG